MKFSSENLELFLAVLDHGSFSAAARALRRVPSAVSMNIGNIEAELGFPLFSRTNRAVEPTALALALAPHARLIGRQLRDLNVHADQLANGLESTLAIAITEDMGADHVFSALATLSTRYPLLDIEILSVPQDEAIRLLRTGRVSLSIAYGGVMVSDSEYFQTIGEETLVATISPDHPVLENSDGAFYLEELIDVRQIVVANKESPIADHRPLVAASSWSTNSFRAALGLVLKGAGWGNFPLSIIRPLISEGRLRQLLLKNTTSGLLLQKQAIWSKREPLRKGANELLQLLLDVSKAG
ncbi:LysR family transcriptional regulator [Paraburkholderia tropica]|uniref:LysR family transcriptional regulator n=1 Tax=Paraburkholderia tropica TaxID=92647 RepID=UPI002AB5EA61|nr:LysR family transcriptional regulator [Paraburkholderia tropica]